MRITMKRIDFENGTVTENILSAALPMLAAQILSRTLFSAYYDHHGLQQSVRERRRTAFFDQPWER